MLQHCLQIIHDALNGYIKRKEGAAVGKITFSSLKDVIGKKEVENGCGIVMSVVDLIHEERGSTADEYVMHGNGGYVAKKQPANFSVHLLFSACSKPGSELEALKYLSHVIAFFQSNNYFTPQNTPALLPLNLDGLSMELTNLNQQEKSASWNSLGVHYHPAVMYKLGIIPIEDIEAVGTAAPAIQEIIIE